MNNNKNSDSELNQLFENTNIEIKGRSVIKPEIGLQFYFKGNIWEIFNLRNDNTIDLKNAKNGYVKKRLHVLKFFSLLNSKGIEVVIDKVIAIDDSKLLQKIDAHILSNEQLIEHRWFLERKLWEVQQEVKTHCSYWNKIVTPKEKWEDTLEKYKKERKQLWKSVDILALQKPITVPSSHFLYKNIDPKEFDFEAFESYINRISINKEKAKEKYEDFRDNYFVSGFNQNDINDPNDKRLLEKLEKENLIYGEIWKDASKYLGENKEILNKRGYIHQILNDIFPPGEKPKISFQQENLIFENVKFFIDKIEYVGKMEEKVIPSSNMLNEYFQDRNSKNRKVAAQKLIEGIIKNYPISDWCVKNIEFANSNRKQLTKLLGQVYVLEKKLNVVKRSPINWFYREGDLLSRISKKENVINGNLYSGNRFEKKVKRLCRRQFWENDKKIEQFKAVTQNGINDKIKGNRNLETIRNHFQGRSITLDQSQSIKNNINKSNALGMY